MTDPGSHSQEAAGPRLEPGESGSRADGLPPAPPHTHRLMSLAASPGPLGIGQYKVVRPKCHAPRIKSPGRQQRFGSRPCFLANLGGGIRLEEFPVPRGQKTDKDARRTGFPVGPSEARG